MRKEFFNYIKCDSNTFQECNNIEQYLQTQYQNSVKEVQDILDISANDIVTHGHSVVLKYVPCSFLPSICRLGETDGEGICIMGYATLTHEMWGTFVHEMFHRAMYAVFGTSNPYLSKLDKIIYKNFAAQSFPSYVINQIRWNLFMSPYKLKSCGYEESRYDGESMARYYGSLATDVTGTHKHLPTQNWYQYLATIVANIGGYFKTTYSMSKWHQYLATIASDKGLLAKDRLLKNCSLESLSSTVDFSQLSKNEDFGDSQTILSFVELCGATALDFLHKAGYKFSKISEANMLRLVISHGLDAIQLLQKTEYNFSKEDFSKSEWYEYIQVKKEIMDAKRMSRKLYWKEKNIRKFDSLLEVIPSIDGTTFNILQKAGYNFPYLDIRLQLCKNVYDIEQSSSPFCTNELYANDLQSTTKIDFLSGSDKCPNEELDSI